MKKILIILNCLLSLLTVSALPPQIQANRKQTNIADFTASKSMFPNAIQGNKVINLVKTTNLSQYNIGFYNYKRDPKISHRQPARIGSTGSTIYGWLTSYNDPGGIYPNVGLNEIDLDGSYTTLFNRNDGISGGGYIRNGNICLYSIEAWYGSIMGAWYREFDIQSGEKITEIEIPIYDEYYNADMSNIFVSFAYNPTDDIIYGYSYNKDGNGYLFSKALATDPTNLTEIKSIDSAIYGETCRSMTYNTANGKLIGINIDQKMVEIDINTGSQTEVISLTDIESIGEASGLVYSPIDKAYIWCTRDLNQEGTLYKINPETKTKEALVRYSNSELFAFFVCPDKAIDLNAPKKPIIKSENFSGTPNLSGDITITIPSLHEDGTQITSKLTLTTTLDGAQYASTTVSPMQDAVVDFKNLTEGNHSFMFAVSEGEHSSEAERLTLFIGNDTPKAPAELWMDETGFHWTPVTESENGGYLDLTKLTYDLVLDEQILATNITGNFYEYKFPTTISAHIAQIQAVCNEKRSYVTTSPTYISGDALQLPVFFKPTESDAAIMTVIDQNGDGTTWNYLYDNYGNTYFAYRYDWTEPANDWIILPAIDLPDSSKLYTLSLDTWSDDYYSERFEVLIGTNPTITSLTTPIFNPTEVKWSEPRTMERTFEIASSGKHYIAIHAISEMNANELRINNIHITQSSASKKGPDKAINLYAQENSPGELIAEVCFNMPEKMYSGTKIDANTIITATVTSDIETIEITGKAGEFVSTKIATVQGNNKIIVQPAIKEEKGLPTSVEVYTGVDVPGLVENLKASVSDDNMTIHLTWDAPVSGENGGYVSPTGNTYMLMGMIPSDYGMRWGVLAEIGVDVLEYDYKLEEGTAQNEIAIGVNVMNAADIATRFSNIKVAAGTPYQIPMTENFVDGRSKYNPIMHIVPSDLYDNTNWTVASPSLIDSKYDTESGFVLLGVSYSDINNSKARATLPKFSTIGCTNVILTLEYAGDVADVEVYGVASDYMEPILIGKLAEIESDASTVYNKYKLTLPSELNNKLAVGIIIDAVFENNSQNALIASYDIRNYVEKDFGITKLSTPTSIEVGDNVEFKADITNYGYSDNFCELNWQVLKGEDIIYNKTETINETNAIQPGETVYVSTVFNANADMLGDVKVLVQIITDDANAANNIAKSNLRISRGHKPVISDLSGTVEGGTVLLSWTVPNSTFTTASFENEEPFDVNPTQIDGFTNIDGDGCDVNGFSEWDCPNEFEPAAFTVWSASEINKIIGTEGIYSASDGDKFLIAFCPGIDASVQPDADDWLISPEVIGGSDVSVDIRPILYMYGPETLEFMVSSTDNSVESFSVLERITISSDHNEETQWDTYRFTLPTDTRYFAIHYISNDKFGIQIDNIKFTSNADLNQTITHYDIYRNDAIIAENIKALGTYIDANAPSTGINSYNVIPIKNNIRGVKSNTALVDMSTDAIDNNAINQSEIIITGMIGKIDISTNNDSICPLNIMIYAPDGRCIFTSYKDSCHTSIKMAPGIYIVQVNNSITKVIVK